MKSKVSTQPLKAIIVDDETLARDVVREHLNAHAHITVLAECSNGFEAVKAVSELKPDLLFLDIQMPKLSGFEVLELLDHECAVIFVTAHDEFALKAFDVHAVDYLLKPFNKERFDKAIELAMKRANRKPPLPRTELAASARPTGKPLERILVREGSKVHVIPVEHIDYIEAQDDYVCIRSDGKSHLKQQRLTELEISLDAKRFVRIHRSYILNIDRLAKIELYAKDSRVAILNDGTKLNVSRSGYDKLKTLL
ncbi:MAG: response regulator [Ignavibacteriae bacterium]|nr:response regulator [Ignavibacteriota bacterium]MCI0707914.1 response regulator [Ignavibacteriota bacterium]